MSFKHFNWQLLLRLAALVTVCCTVIYLLQNGGYPVTSMLLTGLAVLLFQQLYSYINRSNQSLLRFIQAAQHQDFSQSFDHLPQGKNHHALREGLQEVQAKLKQQNQQQLLQNQRLKCMIEHLPVPLLSVDHQQKITLWNHSARRLFSDRQIQNMLQLECWNAQLAKYIQTSVSGESHLVQLEIHGQQKQLSLMVSDIEHQGQKERLCSLQDIASELDKTQLNAWQELVSVLTHEIMNSITPISSLAETSASLLQDMHNKATQSQQQLTEFSESLEDARDATDVVAKRSKGLMNFVQNYRKITRLPEPQRSTFNLKDAIDDVCQLFYQSHEQTLYPIDVQISPANLSLTADPQQFEQLLLNILQNAAQAKQKQRLQININAFINNDSQLTISISDDGPGIEDEIQSQIFVPFFTTKVDGSGVGLALARQIMLAHGGSIQLDKSDNKGTQFSLCF